MCVKALKTASEQPAVSRSPPEILMVDTLPPSCPPKQITPATHTPSAEQQAILALTGDPKSATRGSVMALEQEHQQHQQQLLQQQQQQQQQPVSILSDRDKSVSSEPVSAERHMQLPNEGLGATQGQLEEEFEGSVVGSSLEEADSEPDSIQVCKCLNWPIYTWAVL